MNIDDLANQFFEFKGKMTADVEAIMRDCKLLRNEFSALNKSRRVFSNGWKQKGTYGGVGILAGAGVLETVRRILEHIK